MTKQKDRSLIKLLFHLKNSTIGIDMTLKQLEDGLASSDGVQARMDQTMLQGLDGSLVANDGLQSHKDSVSCVAFSSDGQLVASGGFDGIIQVWDISSINVKCTLDGTVAGIEWVKWHPREHLVLAGLEDSTIWMWNADKNAYLITFSGHASSVTCGDITPDGKTICTGSDDASLRIWNLKTGENIPVVKVCCLHILIISLYNQVVTSLAAHTDSVECIGLSTSAPWVETGSMDQILLSGIYNTLWPVAHVTMRKV